MTAAKCKCRRNGSGIDKEDFGFNAALHEDGKLTDYGYIARSGTEWKELYTGQETPDRYRIMSYPETERTDPEQGEKKLPRKLTQHRPTLQPPTPHALSN